VFGSGNRPFLNPVFQLLIRFRPDKMPDSLIDESTPGTIRNRTVEESDRLLRQGDVDTLTRMVVLPGEE